MNISTDIEKSIHQRPTRRVTGHILSAILIVSELSLGSGLAFVPNSTQADTQSATQINVPNLIQSTAIKVISPSSGQTLMGPILLAINDVPAGTATVEYWLNGKRFTNALSGSYNYEWNSFYGWNGNYVVEAVARDSSGNETSRSSKVNFTIVNPGGGGVTLTSTNILNQTLSGTVTISAKTSLPSGTSLERMLIRIDGNSVGSLSYVPSITYVLDTTTLRNGMHEVVIAGYNAPQDNGGFGLVQVPITVNNGHVLQEIRATYSNIFISPGQAVNLSARAVYTDGQEQPLSSGISFSSDSPQVASVSDSGTVTGVGQGNAKITMSGFGKNRILHVYVDPLNHGFPHLSKGGGVLTVYDPSKSIYMRSLFFLGSQAMQQNPGLGSIMQSAGINTMEENLYYNPIDIHSSDYNSWQSAVDVEYNKKIALAKQYNFGLYFSGDDIARTSANLNNSIDASSFGPKAVQHAFQIIANSGQQVGADMVDEVNYQWGDNPKPTNGAWLSLSPSIPDNAFTTLMSTINSVSGRMPISWPVTTGSAQAVENWEGNPQFSDYHTLYWTYITTKAVYPWSPSLNQSEENLQNFMDKYTDRTKALITLQSAMGSGYVKNPCGIAGKPDCADGFVPGQDTIYVAGMTPTQISASLFNEVARGAAGVRVYAYDTPPWKVCRATKPIKLTLNVDCLQQGSDPFGLGQDRWQALSTSFNLIRKLEPDILQPLTSSIDLGANFYTGAKSGSNSRMLITTNMSEVSYTETVDLSPYMYSGAGSIERYRILGNSVYSDIVANTSSVQQLFEPGQTVIWVFRPNTDTEAPKVSIVLPSVDNSVSGTVNLVASASDNIGVTSVQFKVDDSNFGVSSETDPYSVFFDTTKVSNGSHTISASASDAAGNTGNASPVTIVVNNKVAVIIPPVVPPVLPPVIIPTPIVVPSQSTTTSTIAPIFGLVAEWPLSDGSGFGAVNSSGTNTVLSLIGSPTWSPLSDCKLQTTCLSFNGSTQSAQATLDLSHTSAVTVSFWMNIPAYTNTNGLALEFASSQYGFNGEVGGFVVDPNSGENGGGSFEVGLKGDVGYNRVLFARPTAGAWHQYTFVFDKSASSTQEVIPYVDGLPVAYTQVSSSDNVNNFGNLSLSVMSRGGTTLFASGKIQDIKIYSGAFPPVNSPVIEIAPAQVFTFLPHYDNDTVVADGDVSYLIMSHARIPFTSYPAYKRLGYENRVHNLSGDTSGYPFATTTDGQKYNIGDPAGAHPVGSWLINADNVYYVSTAGIILVPSIRMVISNGNKIENVLPMNISDINAYNDGSHLPDMTPLDSRVWTE